MTYCDGSGIISEEYFAADYAHVVECPGCPACDELLAEVMAEDAADADLEEILEANPLWAGEQEAVYEVQPITPMRHVREVVERIIREKVA